MKRFLVLVFLLLVPSLSHGKEWYNNPQYLTKIPTTNLGDIVKTRPGSGGALPMVVSLTSNNSPTVDIASAVLSVPLYAYSPIAGMAGQYVIGKGLQAGVDLLDRYNDGTLQTNSTLLDLINNEFSSDSSSLDGTNIPCNPEFSACSPGKVASLTLQSTTETGGWTNAAKEIGITWGANNSPAWGVDGSTYLVVRDYHQIGGVTGTWWWWQDFYTVQHIEGSPTPVGPPQQITSTLAQQLANRIAQEIAANNQTIKDALSNLFRDNPNLVPDPPQVTNYDIQNFSNQELYDNRQEHIDYLTNQYNDAVTNNNTNLANYYKDQIHNQETQQQEDVLQQEKEESFSPISDNPFEEPYNPGPFDIPTRFTTFLNNVKSTGLFSFSSSFFNSLPGGGSPIYTVEAGTYGTHTIDLSETMATGLAVLKTVLLLLFGFLSIRVVILKR